MPLSVKVAVIGAGLSGLAIARELQREGHQVVVYEKASRLGGLWLYDPRTESDPLSLDPNREIVHGSLYFSLRTNLPREVMSFSDYPFVVRENGDGRNFPRHEEVLEFLEKFAKDFGLVELIRFNEEVVKVKRVGFVDGDWVVESRNGEVWSKEMFQAVVVCNGHHTKPCLPNLPGAEIWPGKQIHSHNYRTPEPFEGQVIVVVGDGPSAWDISRDVAIVAKEVHLSSRSPNVKVSNQLVGYTNVWQHPKVEGLQGDGEISFEDGTSVYANTIIHCTGYKYDFPFLETNGIVSVDERVEPLYKHVFPPQLAPTLAFLGLVSKKMGFRTVELQCKWIASVLSGRVKLPSREEMVEDTELYYTQMKEMEIPKHHTHHLNPFKSDYEDWLAAQVGIPPDYDQVKEVFRGLFTYFFTTRNDNYRDEWKY